MDSSDSDTSSNSETTISTSSASSSTTLYGKVRTTSEMIIDKSIKARFHASYRHQEFSLPDSIMHYMAMNPKNAKVYQKLIQSCKYFFVKNPILVISSLQYDSKRWAGDWKYINLNNISSKLWITGYVDFNPRNAEDKSVTSNISQIYQCDATMLNITNLNIYYDELIIFDSNVDCLDLRYVTVKYENSTNVQFEKIIQLFPKLIFLD
uniref:Uncharacterized protein n=1 Tax=Panagrolaimus sp. ES5 TaxID=591445 RepID=A0AC34FCP7_9BILA